MNKWCTHGSTIVLLDISRIHYTILSEPHYETDDTKYHRALSGRRFDMYIWLKKGVTKELFEEWKQKGLIGDVELKTHKESGNVYIEVHTDLSPATCLPDIPVEFVERFTYIDHLDSNSINYGIYRLKNDNTEMLVDPKTQSVYISSKSFGSLKEIYSKVRQNKLQADERWWL